VWIVIGVVVLALLVLSLAYPGRQAIRAGRAVPARTRHRSAAGRLTVIIPAPDVLHRVRLRIVTTPIRSQGIITRDNASVDVCAIVYYRVADYRVVVDAVKSMVAIETTLREVVGQYTLDETPSETPPHQMPTSGSRHAGRARSFPAAAPPTMQYAFTWRHLFAEDVWSLRFDRLARRVETSLGSPAADGFRMPRRMRSTRGRAP